MDNVTKIEIENRSTRISITEIIAKISEIMTNPEDISFIDKCRFKGGRFSFPERNISIAFLPISRANPIDKLYFYVYSNPQKKDEK